MKRLLSLASRLVVRVKSVIGLRKTGPAAIFLLFSQTVFLATLDSCGSPRDITIGFPLPEAFSSGTLTFSHFDILPILVNLAVALISLVGLLAWRNRRLTGAVLINLVLFTGGWTLLNFASAFVRSSEFLALLIADEYLCYILEPTTVIQMKDVLTTIPHDQVLDVSARLWLVVSTVLWAALAYLVLVGSPTISRVARRLRQRKVPPVSAAA